MTVAELTRAMEDVEMFKKRVEELESTNQDLQAQLEAKHNVNHELGQILESKIKEYSKLRAEQNRNRAEVNIAATLGSLKSYQLYAAISIISEYYELLAPLVESKSKETLKDLAYLKNLNTGLPPTTISPGLLAVRMAMLRQQIYTESQTLQRAVAEASKASSESILVLDTPAQPDQTTPTPGPTGPIPRRRGPKSGSKRMTEPPKRIVAANQIAPGVQKNSKKQAVLALPSGPHDEAPTATPSTLTLPVTPPTESPSTPNPTVPPTEPSTTTPLSPMTSTAALLQMHKQRMQEQALHASKSPSFALQLTSHGNDAIVIPETETASATTTPTPERDVNKPSESIKTDSEEEVNTSATTRSGSAQEPIDLDESPVAMHLEASDALSEKFRAMNVKRAEQGGVSDKVASIGGGEPSTTTNFSGDFSFTTANLTDILFPDMMHATSTSSSTSPKARQSPGYVSPGKKRQTQDLSPTASSSGSSFMSSFLSASKRPKFPAFELPVVSQNKKATKSSVSGRSRAGPRPKKGRWFLEAVEVPVRKHAMREESE
ncbi:hypothetical protein BG005_008150 [Podila minutissima]|nr:hypothetical protein BG005_008150 [Podila minutissima]